MAKLEVNPGLSIPNKFMNPLSFAEEEKEDDVVLCVIEKSEAGEVGEESFGLIPASFFFEREKRRD